DAARSPLCDRSQATEPPGQIEPELLLAPPLYRFASEACGSAPQLRHGMSCGSRIWLGSRQAIPCNPALRWRWCAPPDLGTYNNLRSPIASQSLRVIP